MGLWAFLLLCLQAQGPEFGSCASALDPNGRHVCQSSSQPPVLSCCPGWKQEGRECPVALCTGPDACHQDEVCVRPGVCRCRPGFFGANCTGRCPDQYWGPDCKESCLCFPNGKCNPSSGECYCAPSWWGPLCRESCLCGPHGHCHPLTGACRCDPGWWAPDCRRPCPCFLGGSRCDPTTGRCHCLRGWWGRTCASRCYCNGSPCAQESGRCHCQEGLWGAACQHRCPCTPHGSCAAQDGRCTCHPGYRGQSCSDLCPAGTFGLQCAHSCGHCKPGACSPLDGSCSACAPGWNGTHCKESCPPGRHGENCSLSCPRCRRGEACHPETGECQNCEAGLMGARCQLPCPAGLFGEGCLLSCLLCFNGSCDPVSGACVCQDGFWGASCNQSCLEGFHGPNCSVRCQGCQGYPCHPISGECLWKAHHTGALVAMILAPLLSLLLCLGCWGCCCRPEPQDPRDRAAAMAAAGEGDPMLQVKHQVLGSLRSSLPCFSLGGHKLPRVTVSHHDTEVPFTPSFIEPPSTVWPSDSSWDSEDGDGDEEAPLPAGGDATELQPGFPPEEEGESALNPEPFGIPRTSSLAKAKRPSVSFAQGTRFGPQSLQGSTEPLGATRKPRGAWGRPTPESEEGSQPPPGSQEAGAPLVEDLRTGGCCYENVEAAGSQGEGGCPEPPTSGTPRGVHKARLAGSRHVARRVEALEAASKTPGTPPGLTTIYVTVGKVGVGEGRGESGPGPVQTILKRLGSLQRSRAPPGEDPRPRRALEGFQKPPRRALGAEKGAQRLPGPEKEEEAAQESGTRGPGAGEGQVEAEGPWPLGGEGDGREGVGSPGRPERGSGGAAKAEAKEGEGEPKYENVPGWSGGF
ncbi:scavenger receptor class F member 1 isoform X4 [Sceloporus undulatus]|uniref:scavenger receptor class F member 1 isoform X4 n=1 Tax=Sceloporus undulatus TaxID=8520 RepID=UPI001C4BE923|nr:scavenger receptor class F member 1 isoform X4 [Sceloporus undulatus]